MWRERREKRRQREREDTETQMKRWIEWVKEILKEDRESQRALKKLYQKRRRLAYHVDFELFWHDHPLNILSKKMFRQTCSCNTAINLWSVIPALSTNTHANTHTQSVGLKHALGWKITDSDTQTCIHGRKENNFYEHRCINACMLIHSLRIFR